MRMCKYIFYILVNFLNEISFTTRSDIFIILQERYKGHQKYKHDLMTQQFIIK